LDTALAEVCLDYLKDDRLGECDLDRHLPDGGRALQAWIREYGLVPRHSEAQCRGVSNLELADQCPSPWIE
jgi:hypothetical protein